MCGIPEYLIGGLLKSGVRDLTCVSNNAGYVFNEPSKCGYYYIIMKKIYFRAKMSSYILFAEYYLTKDCSSLMLIINNLH